MSRVDSVEYAPGRLALEAVPLATDVSHIAYGSARVDKHFATGDTLMLEAGTSSKDGPLTITNLGRFQATDATFPWARVDYRARRWRVLRAATRAVIVDQLNLATGAGTFQRGADNLQVEGQANGTFASGRGRLVGGVSFGRQHVDSADDQGIQTIFDQPESSNAGAVFGQADYTVATKLTASCPPASTYEVDPHTPLLPRPWWSMRWRRDTGCQWCTVTPSKHRRWPRPGCGPPLPRRSISRLFLESALAPLLGGATLGFESIPVLAVGNEHLDVEEVKTIELGYTGVVRHTLLQVAYYRNRAGPFTSGLLPQVGTSFGRLNPSFGPYSPPPGVGPAGAAAIDAAVAAAVPSLAPSMSNLSDGRPVFAVLSLANFGEARTQGLELGSITMLPCGWRVDASYAWFKLIRDEHAPETPIFPNTPSHHAAAGVTYMSSRFDVAVRVRWVDGFDCLFGAVRGSGSIVCSGGPPGQRAALITGHGGPGRRQPVRSRALRDFGGDLLRRRALAHVTVGW